MAMTTRPVTATERSDVGISMGGSAVRILGETVGSARAAASEAAARLPDASARAVAAFDETNRRIQSGTNEMLAIGTALSFGFAVGLLIGGANRLLVTLAMVPAAMTGFTLLNRRSSPSQPRPSMQDAR